MTVADDSRPHRQLKNSLLKTQNGKRGRPKSEKTLTKSNTATRVNWQQPALWKQILDACDYVGRPWEPTKIRDRLRAVNPSSFAQFQAQRILDWRDKNFPDKLVLTESVQRRVADGNLARGNVTRQDILVSLSILLRRGDTHLKLMMLAGCASTSRHRNQRSAEVSAVGICQA